MYGSCDWYDWLLNRVNKDHLVFAIKKWREKEGKREKKGSLVFVNLVVFIWEISLYIHFNDCPNEKKNHIQKKKIDQLIGYSNLLSSDKNLMIFRRLNIKASIFDWNITRLNEETFLFLILNWPRYWNPLRTEYK